MTDEKPRPREMSELTLEEYRELVMECGKDRKKHQGKDFSSACFMSGAMILYFALNRQHEIPAMWILGPLSGRCPFTGE